MFEAGKVYMSFSDIEFGGHSIKFNSCGVGYFMYRVTYSDATGTKAESLSEFYLRGLDGMDVRITDITNLYVPAWEKIQYTTVEVNPMVMAILG